MSFSLTLDTIYKALVSGFNGHMMSDGRYLTSSEKRVPEDAISDGMIPYLSFETGSFTSVEWRRWANVVTWDVSAKLKCISSDQKGVKSNVRQALDDIMERCALISGLPIDGNGVVVPYSPKTSHLFDAGNLSLLVGRFGPILKSAKVTELAGTKYASAALIFGLEFYADLDPRVLKKASVVSIGMSIADPAQRNVLAGWNDTAPPDPADVRSTGRFDRDAPLVSAEPGGPSTIDASMIPTTKAVKGPLPKDLIRSLNITPYAATVAAVATRQMQAIALYQDSSSSDVTALCSWLSSAPSKATINSVGLVTGVATGTSNISATYNGASSNIAVITVP